MLLVNIPCGDPLSRSVFQPRKEFKKRMDELRISLFGKFCLQHRGRIIDELDSCKVQELLCYLLLHRDRPHARELLASLLWGDQTTSRSKQYLRKTLWQLQSACECVRITREQPLLLVDPEWVEVNIKPDVWLDVRIFEDACSLTQGLSGGQLDAAQAESLATAVKLYRGDLLEGWYQEWCLIERERFQHLFLGALDKLMCYHEGQGEYEAGMEYGLHILRYDRAREHTHRVLMRLYDLAGDRTGALRQYERCVGALAEELGVPPAEPTQRLYEQIRTGQRQSIEPPTPPPVVTPPRTPIALLQNILPQLKQLHYLLAEVVEQVEHEIETFETTLPHR